MNTFHDILQRAKHLKIFALSVDSIDPNISELEDPPDGTPQKRPPQTSLDNVFLVNIEFIVRSKDRGMRPKIITSTVERYFVFKRGRYYQ